MVEAMNRDGAAKISQKLTECQNALQKGNVFSCLLKFREALERMTKTVMIPADEKELQKEINEFQKILSTNKNFLEIYGPVTFRDDEIAPSLALMNQLIEIKNDEMNELLEEPPADSSVPVEDPEALLEVVRKHLENGEDAAAVEMVKDDDDMAERLVEKYNTAGIEHRRGGRCEEALREFRKALVLSPRDEGIYYNMARAHIDRGEWKTAAETINEGLKINHDFGEGIQLLKYIREVGKIDE